MQIWAYSGDDLVSKSKQISRLWSRSDDDVTEVNIDNPSDQEKALSMIGMIPWILVRCSNWKMIPLENLIAASRGTVTRVAAAIDEELDLRGAAFALGGGVDAILVPSKIMHTAIQVHGGSWSDEEKSIQKIKLKEGVVTSIESIEVGERVCIDFTRRMDEGEGLAIGSISGNLCLIHAENIPSEYVPTRPFRVNAGAIHSYVLMANGKTKYLSELISGDEVAVFSSTGGQDKATIGRLKIETRPMLMIRFEVSGSKGQIAVQHAETVRIISPGNIAISATDLKKGDKIIIVSGNNARHIGIAINSEVSEK